MNKEKLGLMNSNCRSCFLELERLIKENHIKTLGAIPKPNPALPLNDLWGKVDSLQKQIDHLKNYKRDFDQLKNVVKHEQKVKVKVLKKTGETLDLLENRLNLVQKRS